MSIVQAFVLGLVQGVTEFLPISSSAHLILVPYFFGWDDQGLGFDIVANTGSLLAVIVYFRRDLWATLRSPWRLGAGADPGDPPAPVSREQAPLLPAIALGTVPVVVAGLLVYGWLATGARNPALIASTSIGFGLLLGFYDRVGARSRDLDTLRWRDAAWIGLAQALALIPGTSRSGITLTAGLALGFRREDAARFSFLLYVPVGLAALAHDLKDLLAEGLVGASALPLGIGFVTSAVSAYFVIDWLLDWLQHRPLGIFVAYRVVLGLVIFALLLGPMSGA